MGEYREPTEESRGNVSAVFDAVDSLYYASTLPAPLFRVALATAAAQEILREHPMPFPDAEAKSDMSDSQSPAGQAARAAVHNLMRQDVTKYGNVAIMTGTIMANMHAQCHAQQLLCAVDRPGYAASLDDNGQKIAAIIARDPAERAEMEIQATGEFHKMSDQNQRELLGDSISATLVFMSSDKNFTRKLDDLSLSIQEGKEPDYTPAVFAQAAKEGRLNADESITPARGQSAQPVYQAQTYAAQAAGMGR